MPDEKDQQEDQDPTVEDLQDELRERGLTVSGNKDELKARLAEADADPTVPASPDRRSSFGTYEGLTPGEYQAGSAYGDEVSFTVGNDGTYTPQNEFEDRAIREIWALKPKGA